MTAGNPQTIACPATGRYGEVKRLRQAVGYDGSDFAGGLAARRASVIRVALAGLLLGERALEPGPGRVGIPGRGCLH